MRSVPAAAAAAILSAVLASLAPAPAAAEPLAPGAPAPRFGFTAIDDRTAHTDDVADRLVVYTVADRNSSDRLMAWQREAGMRLAHARPDLQLAFVNIADVTAVPRLLRGIVEPILARIDRNTNEDMAEQYAAAGLDADGLDRVFYLIPDWDGALLQALGVADAAQYHAWLAAEGRIVAHFPEGTPEIADRYVTAVLAQAAAPGTAATAATGATATTAPALPPPAD